MTKKDYQFLAECFAKSFNYLENDRGVKFNISQIEILTRNFGEVLKKDNPLFNEKKFLSACGGRN